jgi:hypothetical protein
VRFRQLPAVLPWQSRRGKNYWLSRSHFPK